MLRLRALLLTIGGSLIALVVSFGCSPRDTSAPLSDDDVLGALKGAMSDAGNLDRMGNARNSHGGQLLPNGFWRALYPYGFTLERLLARGSVNAEPLRRIANDPKRDPEIRDEAAIALGHFDPASALAISVDEVRDKRLSAIDFYGTLESLMPVGGTVARMPHTQLPDWVSGKLAQEGFDALTLEMLDDVMRTSGDSLVLHAVDLRLIRWLNRLNDQDLDDVLARAAPDALAFRNRQLAKGSDPLDPMYYYVFDKWMNDGKLQDAINSTYSDPADRKACRSLFETIHGFVYSDAPPGWDQRVRAWYFANRAAFKYDPQRRRFVVARPVAKGPPTSPAPIESRATAEDVDDLLTGPDVSAPKVSAWVDPHRFVEHYRIAHYLRVAAELQRLRPYARAERLRAMSRDPDHGSEVIPLCRMLFEATDTNRPQAFRRPMLGGASFVVAHTDYADWPLEPITLYQGVPILIVRGYNLAGVAEDPGSYVEYCLAECRWRDFRFAPTDLARLREIVNRFIAERRVPDDADWVRAQAE
ncbi:MAG TPA: hypothetical protein VH475_22595 [Tepidisphaeraceae bacterium]